MAERDSRHVGDLLTQLFHQKGFTRSLRRAEAVLLWPRVVGADVARFSAARSLNNGVLTVDVSDSETAMHLSLQRRRFLARYHDTYGVSGIKEIRFQVGRIAGAGADDQPATGEKAANTGTPVAAEPKAVASMARRLESLELESELSAAVRLAGRGLLDMRARQLAAGFDLCPTCGAAHDGAKAPLTPRERTWQERQPDHPALRERELCGACRRSLQEPRVRDEARRLALAAGSPSQELSESEVAVAQRLAAEYLDASLRDLLPRALSQPSLKPQLEFVARCRCSLLVGKSVDELDDDDLQLLDGTIVRYLGGRWSATDEQ